jgi:hypothetical protein
MSDFFTHVLESLTAGVLLNYVLVPIIMSTALGGIISVAFGRLKNRKEQIGFGIGSFVLFLTLVYSMGTSSPRPILSGSISSVVSGNSGERDTVAVFSISIINTGNMQTIVKNWKVSARSNGRKYDAVFPEMPDNFIFNNIPPTTASQPTSITYHKTDSLLEKSLSPIQVGSILPGVLFVVFQNVDSAVFRAGIDYIVTYEDVFSRSYTMQVETTGSIGTIGTMPGVKAEVTCRIPPGGLPKIGNDITSTLKPPSVQEATPATSP